ncbi:unnamed protein product [Echinostoma caproni]|uniref:BZIP domain-containing protein n=1 Tax=Echinostoma caproni TaxID=27848 RepID=A0A183B6R8_9TREM|nr:unnamed protein product [Echinostoma caproni]
MFFIPYLIDATTPNNNNTNNNNTHNRHHSTNNNTTNHAPRNGTVTSTNRSIPDAKLLDKRYQDRRRRNNEAVRRCRENKRARLIGRAEVTDRLQTENRVLRTELTGLSMELKALRKLLGNQSSRVSETSVDSASSSLASPGRVKTEDGVTTSEPDGSDTPMNGITGSPNGSTLADTKPESSTHHEDQSPSVGDDWVEDPNTPSTCVANPTSIPDSDELQLSHDHHPPVNTESDHSASDESGSQASSFRSTAPPVVLPSAQNPPRMRKRLSRTVVRRCSPTVPEVHNSPTEKHSPDWMDCAEPCVRASFECSNTNQEDLITS